MKTIDELYSQLPSEYQKPIINMSIHDRFINLNFSAVDHLTSSKELKCFVHNSVNSGSLRASNFYSQFVRPVEMLIKFITINESQAIQSLIDVDDAFIKKYSGYLTENNLVLVNNRQGKSRPSYWLSILDAIKSFLDIAYNNRTEFEFDIWYMDKIKISKSRMDLARPIRTLSFTEIKYENNKILCKEYIQYLLLTTNLALSTIRSELCRLIYFLNFLGCKDVQDITRHDKECFLQDINNLSYKKATINIYIYTSYWFLNYCVSNNILILNPFSFYDAKPARFSTKNFRAVEPEVTRQIFEILDQIDISLCCMFLILFCTALRESEICIIKRNDISREGDDCSIRTYSQKMRKDINNYIPPLLYDILQVQDKDIVETFSKDEPYLFRTKSSSPFHSSHFSTLMKDVCEKYNICKMGGEPYIFKSHDFRHRLATYMADNDYPIQIIQRILHHKSLAMLQIYIEDTDEKKKERYFDLIRRRGLQIDPTIASSENLMNLEWIKANVNSRMLSNGVCVLPPLAGNCPHTPNVCLTCDHFRTGRIHLSIHKRHFERACFALENAKENGMKEQITDNEKLCNNLAQIIKTLENTN